MIEKALTGNKVYWSWVAILLAAEFPTIVYQLWVLESRIARFWLLGAGWLAAGLATKFPAIVYQLWALQS